MSPGNAVFLKHHGISAVAALRSLTNCWRVCPEIECAVALDSLAAIDTWVRNIERDQANSFMLRKRHHFFYSDFVARLTDGRLLVLEYKGEMRDYEDEEKRALGELWQSRMAGTGVFAWLESNQVPAGPSNLLSSAPLDTRRSKKFVITSKCPMDRPPAKAYAESVINAAATGV